MIIFKSSLSVFCLCHGMDFIVVHVFIENEHLKFLLDMEIEPDRPFDIILPDIVFLNYKLIFFYRRSLVYDLWVDNVFWFTLLSFLSFF